VAKHMTPEHTRQARAALGLPEVKP
jgi:hypothetical protein